LPIKYDPYLMFIS